MKVNEGRKRSESYMQPSTVDVVIAADNMAHITFAENIQTMTKEPPSPKRRHKNPDLEETTDEKPSVVFIFDSYSLVVPNREGLVDDVNNNPDKWLELAKNAEKEKLAAEVRAKRNKLLEVTDKDVLPDRGSANSEAIIAYRKALRDIPEQADFPYKIKWPHKPQGV